MSGSSLDEATRRARALEANVARVIRGKAREIRRAVIALLARGHLLIEDVPGTGKTMLARALARSVRAGFRRIQFTPDLLPADITGVSIYDPKEQTFRFRPGPVFTEVLLADEINRATPRTQSALLEAMEERQVTADGETRPLSALFFVMATENPIEQQGTFPLPEAELDRFLIRITLGYPEAEVEAEILEAQRRVHPIHDLAPVLATDDILSCQAAVPEVHVDPALQRYIVSVTQRTRTHRDVLLGASPRASLALMRASQAHALLAGRPHVEPEDVKGLAHEVLAHRLLVKPQARVAGVRAERVVDEVLERVEVPVGL